MKKASAKRLCELGPFSFGPCSFTEALLAVSVDTKDDVNRIADAAVKAVAKGAKSPQDYGFTQLRSFLDLDGHHWEIFYMDPAHVQPKS